MSGFSRDDAMRILQVLPRELAAWERAGLLAECQEYSFGELGELRTLRDLRARRISARMIRRAMESMQRMVGLKARLRELSAAPGERHLRFRHEGRLMEPVTQQLLFDFDRADVPEGAELAMVRPAEAPRRLHSRELQELFLQAVRMEESGDLTGAAESYAQILEANPRHAPTLINLGTIRYNQRDFAEAERLYREATAADPRYALAYFDLGNVLDEMGRLADAIEAYGRAVALVPHYADAHYNLALAFERQGQRRRALRHWLTYIRLDPTGPWSAHARGQARRTLRAEKLSIVSRRGRLVQAG